MDNMPTVPSWTYQGRLITDISDMPKDTYGFIYEVRYKPTDTRYIGKKVLFFERNKRLGKKALEALREERRTKGIGGRVPLKQKVITEFPEIIKNYRKFILKAPTGAGNTVLASEIINKFYKILYFWYNIHESIALDLFINLDNSNDELLFMIFWIINKIIKSKMRLYMPMRTTIAYNNKWFY